MKLGTFFSLFAAIVALSGYVATSALAVEGGLSFSVTGTSEKHAPEIYTFTTSVTASRYSKLTDATNAHAKVSNAIQEAWRSLKLNKDDKQGVSSEPVSINFYDETNQKGEFVRRVWSVSQSITFVIEATGDSKQDVSRVNSVYQELAKVLDANKAGANVNENGVAATIPAPTPNVTKETFLAQRKQAIQVAAKKMAALKAEIGEACGLELEASPTISASIPEYDGGSHRPPMFGGARLEAAPAAVDVAGFAASGLSVTVSYSVTYPSKCEAKK